MAGEDSIGYGRPPKENRFKKGFSGNPEGRPRMSRDFRADLCDELAERIEIKDESGGVLNISKQRALLKALVRKALLGDVRATTTLFSMAVRRTGEKAEAPPVNDDEDSALLKDYAVQGEDSHEP